MNSQIHSVSATIIELQYSKSPKSGGGGVGGRGGGGVGQKEKIKTQQLTKHTRQGCWVHASHVLFCCLRKLTLSVALAASLVSGVVVLLV